MDAQWPSHWQRTTIGDAFEFTKKPRGLKYSDYGKVPFVPMSLIPTGSLFFDSYELREGNEIRSGTYFELGDVLVAKITPSFENGKQGIIENLPTSFGVATTEVIPISEIPGVSDRLFLFYYLLREGVRSTLAGKMEGTTGRQRLSKKALADLEIPLPPLPEQRAIARALRAVQAAREARQREVALERERKAALMDHLFTHGTRGEPTKQTPIGEMPQSWEAAKLGGHCQKPEYGYTASATPERNGPKFLRITDIQDGKVSWENVPFCDCNGDLPEKYWLKSGDIVIARIGATTGKAYLIIDPPESIFASYLIRVRTKDTLDSAFLSYFLQTPAYWRQIDQLKGGRLKAGVNIPILKNLNLPLPPLEEQREIAGVLQACDAKIAALDREIALLDELFQALLEALMSGRVSARALMEGRS